MADHFLTMDQQLAAKVEVTAGTFETLAAADVLLRHFRSDTIFTPDYPRFDNDEVAEDIAAAPDFVSGARGGISVGVIVKTAGVVGTVPAIDRFLQGCGMKQQIVNFISVGVQAGGDSQFLAGETYTATGAKAGIIEFDRAGAGVLRYIPVTGGALANLDVIVANGDSATASGSSALYGVKYTPTSTATKTLSIQRAEKNDAATSAHDYLYIIKGAMGKCTITWTPLDVIRFAAEYSGVQHTCADGSFFTGYTYETGTPPKFINAVCQLNGVDIEPAEIVFDCGNTVDVDPAPTTLGGTSGFLRARIAKREPTITVAPFRLKTATLDELGILKSGATSVFTLTLGTTPQIIEFTAPKCQIRGWTAGERSGLRTAQLTLHLTRDVLTDNDYSIMMR